MNQVVPEAIQSIFVVSHSIPANRQDAEKRHQLHVLPPPKIEHREIPIFRGSLVK